jgi:hypothetical protein
MIKAVKTLDPKAAAGLLAQAALSVAYVDSPLGSKTPQTDDLVSQVIEEVRFLLGLTGRYDPESFEKIADFLDREADKLLTPPNIESALFRLAQRGDLPSDLYEINIIRNVIDIYGKKFALEKELIETTIREPAYEQHYGQKQKPHEPTMISLFVRPFKTKWPLKDFSVIVAAQREGFQLHVHQAWRVYPWIVKLDGAKTPIDWLHKFADHYGFEIEIEGKRGHFFLMAHGPVPDTMRIQQRVTRKPELQVTVSRFTNGDPVTGLVSSALIVAIDIQKYLSTIEEWGVRREDILDRFVPPPSARD